MCSISGIIRSGGKEDNGAVVSRMNVALRHRGPDDAGVVEVNCQVCLGNTRLAIIDVTSAGHQPMHDPATGNWITYNGETYNFQQLRREIGDEFGPWQSHTDTEVVLRAYRKWGTSAFAKLRGMFSVAIWDAAKRELVLARDRFGIKPLYFYQTSEALLFASELRALLATSLVPRVLSQTGVASYLNYGSLQGPLTIIENVRSLMPGECLRIDEKLGIHFSTYFTSSPGESPAQDRQEAVARLRARLEESVRLHLVSDVPLGVFLSGGLDSSALVALMSRVTSQRPKTFSVIFNEEKYTEQPYSRLVADCFQTEHSEIHLDEDKLFAMLPAALGALDQPSMDGTNTYVVSRAVKEAGVTVALSGLGGDELFAGYPSFRRVLRVGGMNPLAKKVLRAASGVGSIVLNGSTARKKFWQLCASDGTSADVYNVTRQLFQPNEIEELCGLLPPKSFNGMAVNGDAINAISHFEFTGYMTNTLLRDTDSMSMAHSLEVRVPFVDPDIVSYVFSLSGQWKLDEKSTAPKPLLADAVADLLPNSLTRRRKMGFILPFAAWMQSRLKPELNHVFQNSEALRATGLRARTTSEVWESFKNRPDAVGWSRPWSLFVLAKWCETNRVGL